MVAELAGAVLVMTVLAGACGLLLGIANRYLRVHGEPLVEHIDRLLPQTQCGQCGYPGCRPYAEAIARGAAAIDQCPPGGDATVRALAALLGREAGPVNAAFGVYKEPQTARIEEHACIGCTLCIQACPVDAILGASRYMHTVIQERCTGCELCLPPCPVDCIQMIPSREMRRVATARERPC